MNLAASNLTWAVLFALTVCFTSSSDPPRPCGQDCRGTLSSVFYQANITLLTYTSTCPLYEDFKTCYDEMPEECRTPGPDDIIINIFEFTCSQEGQEKIRRTGECWSNDEVTAAVRTCSSQLYPDTQGNTCGAYANYDSCLEAAILDRCGQEAYEVMTEFVMVTTRADRQRYGCPDPVITRPPLNIRCIDCHSGGGSWRNPHCNVNGTITDYMVGKTSCRDACFAKTDKWNEGVVYRGCADHFLPREYPRPLPRFGCRKIYGETWCFCDSEECNTMSMSSHVP